MGSSERRKHVRLERDEKIFVQIVSADGAPEIIGKTYFCNTLDVSESGLKISVQTCVPEGSELEVWVQIQGASTKYFLHGISQWCGEVPPDISREIFELGIKIYPKEGTDYHKWQYLFDGQVNTLLTR